MDKDRPEDEPRENERGIGKADPEQPSVEWLSQISELPTILYIEPISETENFKNTKECVCV